MAKGVGKTQVCKVELPSLFFNKFAEPSTAAEPWSPGTRHTYSAWCQSAISYDDETWYELHLPDNTVLKLALPHSYRLNHPRPSAKSFVWCVNVPAPEAGKLTLAASDENHALLCCTHQIEPSYNKEAWAFADLGVGIGGGSHALEAIGGTCAFAIDCNDAAAATFQCNHPRTSVLQGNGCKPASWLWLLSVALILSGSHANPSLDQVCSKDFVMHVQAC